MQRHYYSFNEYLQNKFKARVQRISLNAGFGCPNRDGSLNSQGCIFCNEEGFTNFPDTRFSLNEQIERSMEYFKKRFKVEKFIAYFQNASNTYAEPADLKKRYDVIKAYPEIVGLSISTRPDCIDEEKLKLIESYTKKYDVWLECGLQSVHDKTLEKINRSHTYSQFVDALYLAARTRIKIAAHIILGLPEETRHDMLATAEAISKLPLSGVKIHVLHVLRETRLASLYKEDGVKLLTADEYVSLTCDFLEHIRPDIVIMRLVSNAKEDILVAPGWINEKQKILDSINREFDRRKTRQGIKYEIKDGRTARVA